MPPAFRPRASADGLSLNRHDRAATFVATLSLALAVPSLALQHGPHVSVVVLKLRRSWHGVRGGRAQGTLRPRPNRFREFGLSEAKPARRHSAFLVPPDRGGPFESLRSEGAGSYCHGSG
jgi:hypothetical protein